MFPGETLVGSMVSGHHLEFAVNFVLVAMEAQVLDMPSAFAWNAGTPAANCGRPSNDGTP